MADFEEAGDDDVFRKIRKDFDAKRVAQSDQQIRRTMDELMAQAIAQIKRHDVRLNVAGRFPSPAGCAPAKPSTPAGARSPRRSSPRPIAREGFAAVTLDQQHGLWDTASIIAGIAAIRAAGAAPVVRVPLGDFALRLAARSTSAPKAIIAPMINTVADARPSSAPPNSRRSASAAGARRAP